MEFQQSAEKSMFSRGTWIHKQKKKKDFLGYCVLTHTMMWTMIKHVDTMLFCIFFKAEAVTFFICQDDLLGAADHTIMTDLNLKDLVHTDIICILATRK